MCLRQRQKRIDPPHQKCHYDEGCTVREKDGTKRTGLSGDRRRRTQRELRRKRGAIKSTHHISVSRCGMVFAVEAIALAALSREKEREKHTSFS
jgi:hypothetical protein